MEVKVSDIEKVLGHSLLCHEIIHIQKIYFDTRKITDSRNSMFLDFANKKEQSFKNIQDALSRDIDFIITDKELPSIAANNLIKVTSVLNFLQELAKYHRRKFNIPVIGITGSNGKTILKEWIYTLLHEYKIHKSPGSYNSQIGVPLSILGLESGDQYAIIEAGISKIDEMKNLESIISPTFGILTNIGDAHDAGFLHKEEKLKEKLKLFKHAEVLLFNENEFLTKQRLSKYLSCKLISWSFVSKEADYFVQTRQQNGKVIIIFSNKVLKIEYEFLLKDNVSVYNIIFAIISLYELGVNIDLIQKNILRISSVSMRKEILEGHNNNILINDTYNADITSLNEALDFSNIQKEDRKIHLVLAPFDDLNEGYKEEIYSIINSFSIDIISCIRNPLVNISQLKIPYNLYSSAEELIQDWKVNAPENEVIVFKGAQRYNLDHIIKSCAKLVHKTQLNINLHNIQHNIRTYRSILKDNTMFMAVIKAGAYGSDSVRLGKYLSSQNLDYLAVAYIDEGIELRDAGIKTPIMVMNPDLDEMERILENNLEPEIYSIDQLQLLINYTNVCDIPLHLKFDTGMNRLGITEDQLTQVIDMVELNNLKVKSVFTHFHSADDPQSDRLTIQQFERFSKIYTSLEKSLGYKLIKHCCNTSAISRFREFHLDMVRLGVGLYGVSGDTNFEKYLLDVHTWHSYVSQVKMIDKEEGVGYNHRFVSHNKMKIAIVNIGYADGLPRSLSLKNFNLFIGEIATPLIGMISMDTCVIDVSHIREVYPGMRVDITNAHNQTFKAVAKCADMITYELLCQVGPRVKRVYLKE